MYKKIIVPVDLEHPKTLSKSLEIASDLSKYYQADIVYVGITTEAASPIAHTPAEFAAKLEAFAKERGAAGGHPATSKAYASHDPARDLTETLLKAVQESGADLVVMASHVPTFADHLFASHGGGLASRADVSVFVVR
ncbi:MAG: universal stress protein [Flavobacteriaceae bacterium]